MTGSIKIFQFFQEYHKFIGICPSQPNQQQYSINWRNTSVLMCLTQQMLTSFAFLLFEAKSMFEFGLGFFSMITSLDGVVSCSIFIFQKQKTYEVIENCEGFIAKRVHSAMAYRESIGNIELFNTFLYYALCVSTVCVFFTAFPYTCVRYFIWDMGKESFYLFYPTWWPFDWKTPLGYLVAFIGQCVGNSCVAVAYTQFLNLFFGSCWLFIFIADDISKDLGEFNIDIKISDKNSAKLMKQFCGMVQVHTDAKQCVMEFNQIYKYSLLTFFSWNLLAIASSLVTLQFEFWSDALNLYEVVSLIVVLIWVTAFIFILCEPGMLMTQEFAMFGNKLCEHDWYLLPVEMQRMYMIFLSDAQNPIVLSSYGGISCERDTSKKIINNAFSYFMLLRRFRI